MNAWAQHMKMQPTIATAFNAKLCQQDELTLFACAAGMIVIIQSVLIIVSFSRPSVAT